MAGPDWFLRCKSVPNLAKNALPFNSEQLRVRVVTVRDFLCRCLGEHNARIGRRPGPTIGGGHLPCYRIFPAWPDCPTERPVANVDDCALDERLKSTRSGAIYKVDPGGEP